MRERVIFAAYWFGILLWVLSALSIPVLIILGLIYWNGFY
jgi:hypothetical protein